MNIDYKVFKTRRDKVLQKIDNSSILIISGAIEKSRNSDVNYEFRQKSDFIYLTGFLKPNAVLVLNGKTKKSILFSSKKNKSQEIWHGKIIGQKLAKKQYLFNKTYSLDCLNEKLARFLAKKTKLITDFGENNDFDKKLFEIIRQQQNARGNEVIENILHSNKLIHPMRLIKDEQEINLMQQAADISVNAHKQAMQICKPQKNEAEISAVFDYEFRKNNSRSSYPSIVAGGENACVLHYTENNSNLNNGDLLLIDAGCEVFGYASDITRTFPVNSKFSPIQKKVYNWVLEAQQQALLECKPNNTIESVHLAAEKVLIQAMIDLKLVKGNYKSVKKDKSFRKYFMHGTSHWLGIDVHDVGDYKENKNAKTKNKKLKEGMALTVEPGIYISHNDNSAPKELRGIGIRIEDSIVITKKGHINLTDKVPKTIAEIEKICSS